MSLRKIFPFTCSINEARSAQRWLQASWKWTNALDWNDLAHVANVLRRIANEFFPGEQSATEFRARRCAVRSRRPAKPSVKGSARKRKPWRYAPPPMPPEYP